jgi:hypothetical protein
LEAAGYTLADYYLALGAANIIVIYEPPDTLRGFGIDDARSLGDSFIGRNCAVVRHRGGDDSDYEDGPGTEELQAAAPPNVLIVYLKDRKAKTRKSTAEARRAPSAIDRAPWSEPREQFVPVAALH